MKRYAFIATRHSYKETDHPHTTVGRLRKYLKRQGWEVFFERNKKSIYEAYSDGVASVAMEPEDRVLLCHDDIEILTDPENFNKYIDHYLDMQDSGFVGVAGSSWMLKNANWFSSAQKKQSGGGCIFHGSHFSQMGMNHYGNQKQVVALDGVFLAATRKTLDSIELRKPKVFESNWHWYDASYTMQTHIKGLKNYVVPIILRHESGGNYNSLFYEDMKNFGKLFKKHLPAVIR